MRSELQKITPFKTKNGYVLLKDLPTASFIEDSPKYIIMLAIVLVIIGLIILTGLLMVSSKCADVELHNTDGFRNRFYKVYGGCSINIVNNSNSDILLNEISMTIGSIQEHKKPESQSDMYETSDKEVEDDISFLKASNHGRDVVVTKKVFRNVQVAPGTWYFTYDPYSTGYRVISDVKLVTGGYPSVPLHKSINYDEVDYSRGLSVYIKDRNQNNIAESDYLAWPTTVGTEINVGFWSPM
jgi:hypothetical protein